MKGILVLSMEFESPDDVIASIEHINPPSIPHFSGDLRIAVDEVATRVEEWLDE